ncbi:hypothetical protein HDV00_007298 [Rhizophlyctis rosea]|nr:hypothetical protein HDV00_007298 [Rhizophlyctis rosea]
MLRTILAAFTLLLATITCVLAAPIATPEPPTNVTINALTYGGTGCPAGTAAVLIAADKKSFAVIFDQYTVSVSPTKNRDRKNCQLGLELLFPQGYSYSLGTVNYRGSAFLDNKVNGALVANYFFAGVPTQATKTTNFNGPYAENNYVVTDSFDLQAVVWSPCGENVPLSMSSSILLDNTKNKKGSGELTTDSIDGKFMQIYGIQWAKC